MPRPQSELIRSALQRLEAVAGSEPVSADDSALVAGMISPMLATLAGKGVYANGLATEIEDAAFPWLAIILANLCADAFGKTLDPSAVAYAETQILSQAQAAYTSYPLAVDFY